jgi:hypothetical protein
VYVELLEAEACHYRIPAEAVAVRQESEVESFVIAGAC